MDFLNATDPATLTASPQRVFKSRCYFCSSTNSCADHLPTAASTAVRTLNIAQTADSKPPTTAPTTPSRTSSICSPLRDGATSLLESSCLTSRRLESRHHTASADLGEIAVDKGFLHGFHLAPIDALGTGIVGIGQELRLDCLRQFNLTCW